MEPAALTPSTGLTVVAFLFVLTVVVFFHELGHFLVARWNKVTVKVFSVGFGPELLGFNDRQGTRWRLSLIPLGGYVKFLGDETEAGGADRAAIDRMSEEERRGAFANKGVGARAAVVAAGPIANFILAIVIFTAVFSIFGQQVMSARVDAVVAGSAAERAGFQPGDVVVAIDGRPIANFTDLQRIVSVSTGEELTLLVERGDTQVTLRATPELKEVTDPFGNVNRVGILGINRSPTADQVVTERYSLPDAFVRAVQETWFVIERTATYLFELIVGRASVDQLGGPIKVAEISGQVATLGFIPLLSLAAMLSISIGLINLFPIPVLDGGHLLFYLIEAIRGRPLSDAAQEVGFRFGFAALLALMVFTVLQDTGLLARLVQFWT
jgi:regulator of sigma E protease